MAGQKKETQAWIRLTGGRLPVPDASRPQELIQESARARKILRDRARALAKALHGRAPELPGVEILMFRLGVANYGLPTSFVREVVPAPRLVPLPGASELLLGIAAVRGDLLPVLNVLRLVDSEPTMPLPEWPMIVVGEKAPEFGLLAEEVFPSRPVSIDDILAGSAGSDNALVRGVTPEGTVILDGRALLSDARLFL